MPKYSIIVPAYNAEDRIRKVLGSVTSQEFKDYELIVVCDSCKDNTEKIAREEFGAKTFEVEFGNDGLSRSKGLDEATGEWVLFLDDDDWWLHEFCLSMIDQAVNQVTNTKDIIQFGFIWKTAGYYPSSPNNRNKQGYTFLYSNVWTKCFRRSFIGDTRFPNVHSVSDARFMDLIMEKSPRIAYLDYPIYYYNYMREGSITEKDKRAETLFPKVVANTVKKSNGIDWSME